MLDRDVAPGVHRLEHAHVNCYLVESETGALTVVDAGLPALWPLLGRAIREIGHRPSDVAAVVLTHAHFDHLGVVWRLQARGVPVWVHAADRGLAGHPYRYAHENVRSVYPVRHPRSVPILARMVAAGALRVRGVTGLRSMADGDVLDVPGSPRVLLTPGHTDGHCALHLPDRDAVLTGDALVTLDPYTGQRGPRIVAGAATADSSAALDALDLLVETRAGTALPGHGLPWFEGLGPAVTAARDAGPS